MKVRKPMAILAGLLFSSGVFAFDLNGADIEPAFNAYGFYQGGQIVKGVGSLGTIDHAWIQKAVAGFKLGATFNERTKISIWGENFILFSYYAPIEEIGKETRLDMFLPHWGFKLYEAKSQYTFGDLEQFPLQINVGYFPYKYNPQARNLGEFLFRGSAYPTLMYHADDMEDAWYPMLGFMLSTQVIKNFKADLMLFTETIKYPTQDFSLGAVAQYNIANLVEIGAGFDLERIFSVKKNFTQPTDGIIGVENMYSADTAIVPLLDANGDTVFDPVTFEPRWTTELTNKKYYTFAARKAMARICINPQALFDLGIFGEEDLKLYGELGVLGFDNYGTLYDCLHERMPWMIGFNFPGFKIVDVLALELEHFPSDFVPSYDYAFRRGWPKPLIDKSHLKFNPLRWSVFVKKQLGAFTFSAQAARDHMKPNINNLSFNERSEVLPESDHWWWTARVGFGF